MSVTHYSYLASIDLKGFLLDNFSLAKGYTISWSEGPGPSLSSCNVDNFFLVYTIIDIIFPPINVIEQLFYDALIICAAP